MTSITPLTKPRKRDDYRTMSGVDKAAMLFLAIGEEHSAKLFRMMQDDEIKELSQAMASLGIVDAEIVEKLFIEFAENFSTGSTLVGSLQNTERLLSRILDPERASQIMEEIRGPAGLTMWDKLANVNEAVLGNYLKNEYPQTVAVVLSKIRADHASKVLALLPQNFAMEVVGRMLKMEPVQKDILMGIERTLRTEFMSNLARTQRRDSHEMMADIFNSFDRATEQRFMIALEEQDKEASDKIKSLMFTFEDMNRLDPAGIQTLLKNADKDKVAIALKGASEGLRELFFSNMSERAAKILREDMEALGPVKVRDVDESQQYLIQMARSLADKGEINISDKGGEEMVY
ncbi:MAG: flagellar motor switch protein FliG [Holosporales bacterium]|jgi:flagellar motor switch protein FliG